MKWVVYVKKTLVVIAEFPEGRDGCTAAYEKANESPEWMVDYRDVDSPAPTPRRALLA